MKTIKNWDEIKNKFEKMSNMSFKPSFKKLSKGTIIDKNKSVKWNREQVELNGKN